MTSIRRNWVLWLIIVLQSIALWQACSAISVADGKLSSASTGARANAARIAELEADLARWRSLSSLKAPPPIGRPRPNLVFDARATSVYDGDTFDAVVSLGMRTERRETFRLMGVDCAEIRGTKGTAHEAALRARDELGKLLAGSFSIVAIHEAKTWDEKQEKYGRYLATVITERDGKPLDVAEHLIQNFGCKRYDGGAK